jgi:hypothetical protein
LIDLINGRDQRDINKSISAHTHWKVVFIDVVSAIYQRTLAEHIRRDMKRRRFLKGAGYAAVMTLLSSKSIGAAATAAKYLLPEERKSKKTRFLLGGFVDTEKEKNLGYSPKDYYAEDVEAEARILNLDTLETKVIPVTMRPHAFSRNPLNTNQFITVGKWSQRGCLIDVKEGRVIHEFAAPTGYQYFGHGVFSEDGFLYLTADTKDKIGHGSILVYEPRTWRLLKQIPIEGAAPHELVFVLKDVLLIASARGVDSMGRPVQRMKKDDNDVFTDKTGSLIWLNVKSCKILRKVPAALPTHLLKLNSSELLVGNAADSINAKPSRQVGSLYKVNIETGEIMHAKDVAGFSPDLAYGEKLSIGKINEHLVASTTSKEGKVIFWDLRRHLVFSHELPKGKANGLAVAGNHVFVASGKEGALFRLAVSADGNSVDGPQEVVSRFANSSHISTFEY